VFGILGVGLLGVSVACSDRPAPETPVPPTDSASTPVAAPDSIAPLTPSTWDPSLGELLLLPPYDATSPTRAIVLRPSQPLEADPADTLGLPSQLVTARVALLSRRGVVSEVALAGATLERSTAATNFAATCGAPPRVTWAAPTDSAAAAQRGWLVALPVGVATAVPFDSIEALPTRDSATLAAGLTRLASGVTEDSTNVFRGLPMTVVRAYRSTRGTPGLVVADLMRRVPQEDQPLVEHLTLVVEQAGAAAASWRVVWSERLTGREEEVLAFAPLALLERADPTQRALLLGRDVSGDPEVLLLEHRAGQWLVRWSNPFVDCSAP
jgi:hypothetical protein